MGKWKIIFFCRKLQNPFQETEDHIFLLPLQILPFVILSLVMVTLVVVAVFVVAFSVFVDMVGGDSDDGTVEQDNR